METSRDDSLKACAHCGTPLTARAGGGRRADYCSRACQAKAYRARLIQHTESARDDSQWSALTARAVAAETEAASLREQLADAQRRADGLAAELKTLRAKPGKLPSTPPAEMPEPSQTAPALPPPIRAGSGTRRYEQTGTSAWAVYVDDIPVGNIRLLSGKHWATLPNGFEVRSGTTDLDDAAHDLVLAYNGWSNYWHAEAESRLTLLKPRQDGSRGVKWGASTIGKVIPSGAGWNAAPTGQAMIGRTGGPGAAAHPDARQAADALLERWRAEHSPPWGGLTNATP